MLGPGLVQGGHMPYVPVLGVRMALYTGLSTAPWSTPVPHPCIRVPYPGHRVHMSGVSFNSSSTDPGPGGSPREEKRKCTPAPTGHSTS